MYSKLGEVESNWNEYEGEQITISCRVVSEPRFGERGGDKTLYRISDATGTVGEEPFVSFWHESPHFDGVGFDRTDTHILDSIIPERGGHPLEQGENIIVRAVPYSTKDGRRFLNVGSILIRRPEYRVGKGQMRLPNECDRLLHLLFVKDVYRPRDSYTGGNYGARVFRGNIAHKALEYAVDGPQYLDYFERDMWDQNAVENLIQEVIDKEFVVEQALHSLRGTGKNRAIEEATDAISRLVSSDEFVQMVQDAEQVESERAVAPSYGFEGYVDLVLDGVPIDLKTGERSDKDRFQLKLYLLALRLEELEPGEELFASREEEYEGYIAYVKDPGEAHLERVTLRASDVDNLLSLRNQVASVTSAFGVPSPYDQDCDDCILREGTDLGGLDSGIGRLPSPCKFHCQTERRWPCYEITGEDIVTRCPLFEECEERLVFREPDITDYYNELREALRSERRVRRDATAALTHLPERELRSAGLLLTDLQVVDFLDDNRIAYSTERDVVGFSPGDAVQITREEWNEGWKAVYLGKSEGKEVFEFETRPGARMTNSEATYIAHRTPEEADVPRRFLRMLDFAQRAEVDPRLNDDDATVSIKGDPATLDSNDIESYLNHEELFFDVPVRPERSGFVSELVRSICTATLPRLTTEGTVPYGSKRTLVLTTRPSIAEAINDELRSTSNFCWFDEYAISTDAMPTGQSQHELKTALEESKSILSSVNYAIEDEIFHYMDSYDKDARPHSNRFFDTLVLVGADKISEPEYHFLSKLADRTVSIADVQRSGIEILSEEAEATSLAEPYFRRGFERYSMVDAKTAKGLRASGAAPETVVSVLGESRLKATDGDISFVHVDGQEQQPSEQISFETYVGSGNERPSIIDFELVDTSTTLLDIESVFADQTSLDESVFEVGEVQVINDTRLLCKEKQILDADTSGSHRVRIGIPTSRSLFFRNRLLSNNKEARKVAKVAAVQSPDRIVTPFAAQAQRIRTALSEASRDIDVQLPGDLSGECDGHTLVSLVVANNERRVHEPVSNYETLYSLLTAGSEVTLFGHEPTLTSNNILEDLINRCADASSS